MDGVGPGSLLAGRYRVQRLVRSGAGSTFWQAQDETLDRAVSLRVVDSGHPNAGDLVDAARRAAGVEDPRLQRILDVGAEDEVTYVVSEWVSADSLADLLRSGSLPAPEEVRRLVGEAASALEAARHRGLHHLALTPDCLLRSHDGPVSLTGLGVDAALLGLEVASPTAASRTDAQALVALIYAGLTGRWPLGSDVGLAAAPRVGSAVPPPSELASGVPADLDALCQDALFDGGGPSDPGAVATTLAPWPALPVAAAHRATGTFPMSLADDTSGATTVLPAVPADSVQARVSPTRADPPPPPPTRPPSTYIPPAAAPQAAVPPAGPLPGFFNVPNPDALGSAAAVAATPPPAPPAPPAPPVPPALPVPVVPVAPVAPTGRAEVETTGLQAPAPLLPALPTARPPQRQTRAVLGVVAAFVLVLAVLAYCGLRQPGGSAHPAATATNATGKASNPVATTTAGSGSSASSSTSATTGTSPAGGRLTVVASSGFDPQGDGSEKDNLAPKAYDHDRRTGWVSDTYKSPAWSGLKKGVGLRLDLGRERRVTGATVRVGGSGATIQLRAVSGSTLAGSTILATAAEASGKVDLTASTPVTTRYVVIWFTVPAQFSDGFRAEVDDVRLR